MGRKFNVLNYEEALDILSEEIDFGANNGLSKEQKKNLLYGFVDYTARL